MSELFEARVEAGARALRERMFPGVDLPLGDSAWVAHAREVLLAADAVVTEGEVEEALYEALYEAFQDWNDESDDLFAVQAKAVVSLFRGGAK